MFGHSGFFFQRFIFETALLENEKVNCPWLCVDPLPSDKISGTSKMTAKKLNMPKIIEFSFERVDNRVGKGENAGYPHFMFPAIVKTHEKSAQAFKK